MGRHLIRAGLFLLLAFAVLIVIVFGAAIIFGGDSTTRLMGVVLTLVGLAIGYLANFGLSRLPAPGWEEKQRERREAREAEENRPPDDISGEIVIHGRGRLSRDAELRLTPQGFEATHPRRSVAHTWDEIASITPVVVGPVPVGVTGTANSVGFKLRDGPFHHPSRAERFSRWFLHADELIPGLYERSPHDVADLMERYRERYSTVLDSAVTAA
jgi:hypothetical protein